MGCFHKALPNVKSAYVTLLNFTPDLQKIYTDISAVSVTLCNSGDLPWSVSDNHRVVLNAQTLKWMDLIGIGLEWTSERKEHRTAALIIGDNENEP